MKNYEGRCEWPAGEWEWLVISSCSQLPASLRAANGSFPSCSESRGSARLFDLCPQRIRCCAACSVIWAHPPLTTGLLTVQLSLASRSSLQSRPFLPPRTPRRLFPLSVAALSPSPPAKLLEVVSARQRPWLPPLLREWLHKPYTTSNALCPPLSRLT